MKKINFFQKLFHKFLSLIFFFKSLFFKILESFIKRLLLKKNDRNFLYRLFKANESYLPSSSLQISTLILSRNRLIDDPVGAISVHGVVGLFGLLVVPVTNDGATFVGQIAGAATIFVWVFAASLVTWLVLKAIMGLRVSEDEEYSGLDIVDCGLEAYPDFSVRK